MATKQNEPSQGPAMGLRVISKRDGFRRGGHAFGSEPKVIPLADLTEEQADAIGNEPMLFVNVVPLLPTQNQPAAAEK
jgi:hypothetical protein